MNEQGVTFEVVLAHLRTRDFAVLSTVSNESTPHAVGVNYGVSRPGRDLVIYMMTRRHLQKARNIAQNPSVSLVVPLTSVAGHPGRVGFPTRKLRAQAPLEKEMVRRLGQGSDACCCQGGSGA